MIWLCVLWKWFLMVNWLKTTKRKIGSKHENENEGNGSSGTTRNTQWNGSFKIVVYSGRSIVRVRMLLQCRFLLDPCLVWTWVVCEVDWLPAWKWVACVRCWTRTTMVSHHHRPLRLAWVVLNRTRFDSARVHHRDLATRPVHWPSSNLGNRSGAVLADCAPPARGWTRPAVGHRVDCPLSCVDEVDRKETEIDMNWHTQAHSQRWWRIEGFQSTSSAHKHTKRSECLVVVVVVVVDTTSEWIAFIRFPVSDGFGFILSVLLNACGWMVTRMVHTLDSQPPRNKQRSRQLLSRMQLPLATTAILRQW